MSSNNAGNTNKENTTSNPSNPSVTKAIVAIVTIVVNIIDIVDSFIHDNNLKEKIGDLTMIAEGVHEKGEEAVESLFYILYRIVRAIARVWEGRDPMISVPYDDFDRVSKYLKEILGMLGYNIVDGLPYIPENGNGRTAIQLSIEHK